MSDQEDVVIVWTNDAVDLHLYSLTRGGSRGPLRTFPRNSVDSRVGEFVYADDLQSLAKILRRADETKIAIPVSLAKKVLPDQRFA